MNRVGTRRTRLRYALEVKSSALTRLSSNPLSLATFALVLPLAGCHGRNASGASQADQRALLTTEREQLSAIPLPNKSRYMAVHSFDSWENPYITVQPDMLTIHVLRADANTSDYGAGGMLRPVGARREEVNVAPSKLGEALSSIPQTAWPYGRVLAVEEAHKTPPSQEPVVRRNLEATVAVLSDLGVAAYDITEGNLR